ncbi:hypothetical protein B2J88_35885 [Rhodococcus sp. SRB_17]|nr:hypothetical protein [Rhodococcus sp. SRB_17]
MSEPVPEFDADFRILWADEAYKVHVPSLGISAIDEDLDKATSRLVRQLRHYAYWWTHTENPASDYPERSAALVAQVNSLTDEEVIEWINHEPDPTRTYVPRSEPIPFVFSGFEVFLEDDGTPVIFTSDLGLASGEQTLAETVADMTHAVVDYADQWIFDERLRKAPNHIANGEVVKQIRDMCWSEVYDWILGEVRQEPAIHGMVALTGPEAEGLYEDPLYEPWPDEND